MYWRTKRVIGGGDADGESAEECREAMVKRPVFGFESCKIRLESPAGAGSVFGWVSS